MYCVEVFHLWLRHALLIQQSCNSSIYSDSLTHNRKKAVTNVLKCSFSKCSDWHELHSSEKYGGLWNFSGWYILKQYSCWEVRSLLLERQKKEINHPHVFYSWGSPGNNPDPVDVCPRLVDNDCSCLATTSCSHFGQRRNEQNAFVTVELRKDRSMHMFEANKELKVILQSVKLIFQEPVKGPTVFTWVQHTSQGQSKQLHDKGQPKALWLVETIMSLKDCKQDRQCQTLTGAERSEEQSCARNFCAMCFHSLPLILKLPAALGGCIILTQACIFRPQSEVLPGWDYKRWSCPLSHGKWAFMYKGGNCY